MWNAKQKYDRMAQKKLRSCCGYYVTTNQAIINKLNMLARKYFGSLAVHLRLPSIPQWFQRLAEAAHRRSS